MTRSSAIILRLISRQLLLPALMLIAAAQCLAQSDSPSAASSVKAIIDRLGLPDAANRDIAQHRLMLSGREALPAIRQAIDLAKDPDIKTRLQSVLQTLDLTPATTLVTLSLKDVSAREAVEELAKVSGIPLSASRPIAVRRLTDTRVSVEARNEPFWSALLQICDKADLRPDFIPGLTPPGLVLTELYGHWCRQFTCVDGPIAIAALDLSSPYRVDFAKIGPIPPQPVRLHLVVCAEQAACIQTITSLAITRSVDEYDNPVLVNIDLAPRLQGSPIPFQDIYVQLRPPAESHKVILQGEVRLLQGQPAARVEFANLLTATNQIRVSSGIRFQLKGAVQASAVEWNFKILLPRDGHTNLELRQLVDRLRATTPRVEDATGRLLDARDRPAIQEFDEGTVFSLDCIQANHGRGVPGEPAKLVWNIPGQTKTISVPFRFADLPLP